jgi:prevent-host-death family protein
MATFVAFREGGMLTIRVGVREAKGNLSKLLKKVKNGAQVVITDHGSPVGKIIPVNKEEQDLSDRLKDLETRGILQLKSDRGLPKPIKTVTMDTNVDVQGMLQEDRNRK